MLGFWLGLSFLSGSIMGKMCNFLKWSGGSLVFILLSTGLIQAAEKNTPRDKEIAAALERPAASVNGTIITNDDLIKTVRERIPQTGHGNISAERFGQIRGQLLETLILRKVLYQEAQRLKIIPSAKELRSELETLIGRFNSEAEFTDALEKQGMTVDEIREGLRRHLAIKVLSDREVRSKVNISDEDMKTYYDANPKQFFQPEQVRARIILLSVDPAGTQEQWDAAKKSAEALAERVRQGEDFGELARKYSDDQTTRDKGGDIGLLHRGRLPYEELEPGIFSQEVGTVGDPVQSLYGYLLYRVEEKKEAQKLSFEKLNKGLFRKEMEASAIEKGLKEWADALRAKAEIVIYPVRPEE